MELIHPRRFLRKVVYWIETSVFLLRCRKHNVRCQIGENTRLRHCHVRAKLDGTLIIGANCDLRGASFVFYGTGARIELKDRILINAYPNSRVIMFAKGNSSILVDSFCLFSNSIDIATTDWHSLYDDKDRLLNPEKDVHIGKHVWIGRKVTVCKGVSIPDDSVIGVGSIVTMSFCENNVVIAGNPAEIKKRGIHWVK